MILSLVRKWDFTELSEQARQHRRMSTRGHRLVMQVMKIIENHSKELLMEMDIPLAEFIFVQMHLQEVSVCLDIPRTVRLRI